MLKLSVVKNDCYRLIRALRHVKVKLSPSEHDIRRRAGGGAGGAASALFAGAFSCAASCSARDSDSERLSAGMARFPNGSSQAEGCLRRGRARRRARRALRGAPVRGGGGERSLRRVVAAQQSTQIIFR